MKHASTILKIFFQAFVLKRAERQLKRRGVLFYLKAVQGLRRGLAGSLAVFLFFQIMILSFVGAVVTGVLLLPHDQNTKLLILFGVFAFSFGVPFVCLLVLFSEKIWFQVSGAEKMVKDLNQNG